MGLSKHAQPQLMSSKLPTLRFRAKIMLGFAVVLAVSAVSMGIAYLGFERVSAGVASYRNSVLEADLARNIDRELISYQALAVTGKEDDGKAALTAEAGLKDAIDRSMKGTANPARLDQVRRLANEFGTFTRIFADILKVKSDSALVTQNQLTHGGTMLRYKLDDLASKAAEAELPAVELGAKQVATQYLAVMALANTFAINSDQAVATSALARLKFVENSLQAISSTDENILQGLKEASGLLAAYRQAFGTLVENSKSVDQLTAEMAKSTTAIIQGSSALKADLLSDQRRFESESDAIIGQTERLMAMLAAGSFMLGAALAMLLGRGISRPMTTMCQAMRELANGKFDVVLPGLGRKDELGEMAGAVEELSCRPSPRPGAMPPRRTPRTGPTARRAEPNSFASRINSKPLWAPSLRMFRRQPFNLNPPPEH